MQNLADTLADREEQLRRLTKKLFHSEGARRDLHNIIQELKGNVRVIARVRPFLGQEVGSETLAVDFHPNGRALPSWPDVIFDDVSSDILCPYKSNSATAHSSQAEV